MSVATTKSANPVVRSGLNAAEVRLRQVIAEQHHARISAAEIVRAYLDACGPDAVSSQLFGGPSRDDEVARVIAVIRPPIWEGSAPFNPADPDSDPLDIAEMRE